MKLHINPLRLRLNALLRAFVRDETVVKGQSMTREAIIAEIRAIAAKVTEAKGSSQN